MAGVAALRAALGGAARALTARGGAGAAAAGRRGAAGAAGGPARASGEGGPGPLLRRGKGAQAAPEAAEPAAGGEAGGRRSSAWGGRTPPHGGVLVNRMADSAHPVAVGHRLVDVCAAELELSDRNACDAELLCVGGFSPLEGFLCEGDYRSVLENMRLQNGLLFGLPVVLDTDDAGIRPGMNVLLKYGGRPMAVLEVEDAFEPDKTAEAQACYGTTSLEHPGVRMIAMERGKYYLGGKIHGLELPRRDFPCRTPEEVRASLPPRTDVVAFQCRNPIHRAHYELFTRALDAEEVAPGAVCLVHPTCGPTQGDDIPGPLRYKTYEVLRRELDDPRIAWAYLPYSMHMAGPREALQHMLIRKNYGCTHFIIGRDMAGCKSSLTGEDFYGAYDAQDLARQVADELGVQTVPSLNVMYTEERGYQTADVVEREGLTPQKLSGTKFRQMLRAGEEIPEWFAFKSVVQALREG